MSSNFHSDMKLLKVIFDELSFKRTGFKNENEPLMNMSIQIGENEDTSIHKVSLTVTVLKKDEYDLTIKISGFFALDENSVQRKEDLLKKNAVAILMPFVRSEASLLTAQPETECLLLPAFNIARMMDEHQ